MSWNYRIIEFADRRSIHEVYYDEKGRPTSYAVDPVVMTFDLEEAGPEALKQQLGRITRAVTEPVLLARDFSDT